MREETLTAPLGYTFAACVWGGVNVIIADVVMAFTPPSVHFVLPLVLGASIAHKIYKKLH
jgi:hypothetical protein